MGFRKYMGLHTESWYRFVNGPCGRMAKNGDLCLVIGCDKSSSWGITTFSNSFEHTSLQFRRNSEQNNRAYAWEHSRETGVRVSPGQGKNDGLHPLHDSSTIGNQCLFVRVLKIKLADWVWTSLSDEVGDVVIKTETNSFEERVGPIPQRHGTDRSREKHGQPSRISAYKSERHSTTSPIYVPSAKSRGTDEIPVISSGSRIISVGKIPYFIAPCSKNLRRICVRHLSSMTTYWKRFASTLLHTLIDMMLWFYSFQMQIWQRLQSIWMHRYSLL